MPRKSAKAKQGSRSGSSSHRGGNPKRSGNAKSGRGKSGPGKAKRGKAGNARNKGSKHRKRSVRTLAKNVLKEWKGGMRKYAAAVPQEGGRTVFAIVEATYRYPGKRPKRWQVPVNFGRIGKSRADSISLAEARTRFRELGFGKAAFVDRVVGVVSLQPRSQRAGRRIGKRRK